MGNPGWLDKQYKLNEAQLKMWPEWMRKSENIVIKDQDSKKQTAGKTAQKNSQNKKQ